MIPQQPAPVENEELAGCLEDRLLVLEVGLVKMWGTNRDSTLTDNLKWGGTR